METKKVVLDSFHAEAKDVICEANDDLVIEKNEKKTVKNDILNILMNVSKSTSFENCEQAVEVEEKHA